MAELTPITETEASLLAAIIASADDDSPRLFYADWLEENGQALQAAFIRDSIRHAQIRWGDNEGVEEWVRIHQMWYDHGADWLSRLGIHYEPSDHDWERGLLCEVSYWSMEEFLNDAQATFARAPIRKLWITCSEEDGPAFDDTLLTRMSSMPGLRYLRELYLENGGRPISPDALDGFLRSAHLSGLNILALRDCRLTDAHATILAGSPAWANLKQLFLDQNPFSPTGGLAILESPNLSNLTWLSFQECPYLTPYNDSPYAREIDDPSGRRKIVAKMLARFGPPGDGHLKYL
jgi:uncharacterized protein (TIGR02996 family)